MAGGRRRRESAGRHFRAILSFASSWWSRNSPSLLNSTNFLCQTIKFKVFLWPSSNVTSFVRSVAPDPSYAEWRSRRDSKNEANLPIQLSQSFLFFLSACTRVASLVGLKPGINIKKIYGEWRVKRSCLQHRGMSTQLKLKDNRSTHKSAFSPALRGENETGWNCILPTI